MIAGASQAADLPSRKAEPVSYVKICDAYGLGFFVIPGTNTCMRIAVSAQVVYYGIPAQTTLALSQSGKGGVSAATANGAAPGNVKNIDYTNFNSNGAGIYQNAATQDVTGSQVDVRAKADTRTITDFGVLRTYAGVRFKWESGIMAGSGSAITANGEGGSEQKPAIDSAYIQFAGLTAGYLGSPFTFYYEDDIVTALSEPHGSAAVLNYTLTFGDGYSFQFGVDNPAFHIDKGGAAGGKPCCSGLDANGAHGGSAGVLGPYQWPALDLVARVDQPWGSAEAALLVRQSSVAVPNTLGLFNGGAGGATATAALPTIALSQTGYALLGGVKINMPTGDGDQLWLQGIYCVAALEACGIGGNQGNLSYGSQTRLLGGFQRQDMDSFVVANMTGSAVKLESTSALSLLAVYKHWFVPDTWRGNIFLGYTSVTPGTDVRNTDWAKGGLSAATEWKAGANVTWTPVKFFDITGEVMYTQLNQKLTSDPGAPASCSAGSASLTAAQCAGMLSGVKVSPGNVETALQLTRRF